MFCVFRPALQDWPWLTLNGAVIASIVSLSFRVIEYVGDKFWNSGNTWACVKVNCKNPASSRPRSIPLFNEHGMKGGKDQISLQFR